LAPQVPVPPGRKPTEEMVPSTTTAQRKLLVQDGDGDRDDDELA